MHLPEILKAWKEGKIEVRTPTGQVVNLDTFTVSPAAVEKPQPNVLPDSVARDKQIGLHVRSSPEMPAQTEKVETPALVAQAQAEAAEEADSFSYDEPLDKSDTQPPPVLIDPVEKGRKKKGK
jgi:hypothetical protein